MADQTLARPFQFHMPGGQFRHGVQFPSGRVFIDGGEEAEAAPVYGISLGDALERLPSSGIVLWPEDVARFAEE